MQVVVIRAVGKIRVPLGDGLLSGDGRVLRDSAFDYLQIIGHIVKSKFKDCEQLQYSFILRTLAEDVPMFSPYR